MKQKMRVGASSRIGTGGRGADRHPGNAAVAVARGRNGRRRTVGDVAVDDAIAVVHGTHKLPRPPFCLPLPCPCRFRSPGNRTLLPGCAAGAEPFWKNFFFFRPWPLAPCSAAAGCRAAPDCFARRRRRGLHCSGWPALGCCCGCAWGALAWLDLFLRRRRRRRCPCDCPWPLAGAGPRSVWGCVDSVVMRILPGTLQSDALRFR